MHQKQQLEQQQAGDGGEGAEAEEVRPGGRGACGDGSPGAVVQEGRHRRDQHEGPDRRDAAVVEGAHPGRPQQEVRRVPEGEGPARGGPARGGRARDRRAGPGEEAGCGESDDIRRVGKRCWQPKRQHADTRCVCGSAEPRGHPGPDSRPRRRARSAPTPCPASDGPANQGADGPRVAGIHQ